MVHIDDTVVYILCVSGDETCLYRYIYNRNKKTKLYSHKYAQKKHHKKGGSS